MDLIDRCPINVPPSSSTHKFMQMSRNMGFPDGPVNGTPCSQCRGLGSIPVQGTKMLYGETTEPASSGTHAQQVEKPASCNKEQTEETSPLCYCPHPRLYVRKNNALNQAFTHLCLQRSQYGSF